MGKIRGAIKTSVEQLNARGADEFADAISAVTTAVWEMQELHNQQQEALELLEFLTNHIETRALAQMLISSFRHTLGLRTYFVEVAINWIKRCWPVLTTRERLRIQGDIGRAIARRNAGMCCDIHEWRRLLALEVESEYVGV